MKKFDYDTWLLRAALLAGTVCGLAVAVDKILLIALLIRDLL